MTIYKVEEDTFKCHKQPAAIMTKRNVVKYYKHFTDMTQKVISTNKTRFSNVVVETWNEKHKVV